MSDDDPENLLRRHERLVLADIRAREPGTFHRAWAKNCAKRLIELGLVTCERREDRHGATVLVPKTLVKPPQPFLNE